MCKCRKCNGTRMAIKPNGVYMKQLAYLMEGRYYRRARVLAADLCVSRQSLYAWKRGTTIPGKENRERVRDLFVEVKQEDEKEN